MNSTAIKVQNLSKRYRIGLAEVMHDSLASVMVNLIKSPAQNLRHLRQLTRFGENGDDPGGVIWALKDISFAVERGEVVGIIGHNGAGKSTLLKVLSHITHPTSGRVELYGRVSSLLEVGTGFHPELTGRENIYLNGTILGMRKAEIDHKFDEIVDFSGVERFLDTPVKRYSSGMRVRLAFSVAAHLEPEILIVDEVLAVGDTEFQKKCLAKMDHVATKGRTVLFVSHSMNAVQRLCSRTIMLEQGRVIADGDTPTVVNHYLTNKIREESASSWIDVSHINRSGNKKVYVESAWYSSENETVNCRPYSMGPLVVRLTVISDAARAIGSIAVTLRDRHGTKMINADTISLGQVVNLQAGRNVVQFQIDELYLNPGTYFLGWWIADPLGDVFDFAESVIRVEVIDRESKGLGVRPEADGAVTCNFQLTRIE